MAQEWRKHYACVAQSANKDSVARLWHTWGRGGSRSTVEHQPGQMQFLLIKSVIKQKAGDHEEDEDSGVVPFAVQSRVAALRQDQLIALKL